VAGSRWAIRDDVPDTIAERIKTLIEGDTLGTDLEADPPYAATVRAALGEHAPIAGEGSGPCFVVESLGRTPAGEAVHIDSDHRALLAGFRGWELGQPTEVDERQPCFGVVENDRAVSICFSSRRPGTTPGGGVEAGVDTLEGHRRHGYATRLVHAWAAELLRQGRVPLYSTSWDNSASRAVARRLDIAPLRRELGPRLAARRTKVEVSGGL
jgi:hypothetical protein